MPWPRCPSCSRPATIWPIGRLDLRGTGDPCPGCGTVLRLVLADRGVFSTDLGIIMAIGALSVPSGVVAGAFMRHQTLMADNLAKLLAYGFITVWVPAVGLALFLRTRLVPTVVAPPGS